MYFIFCAKCRIDRPQVFLNNGRGQQIDFSVCTELFKNIAGMNLISPWDNSDIFWSSYMVILPW